ncbi:MAG: hypothetical protein KF705_00055 [Phycisphaeraceae bacterium]|nr:hypothetical protein [Phycisphaeraceae bacterium]
MTHGHKPYGTYKDSGEPWLRRIPSHWDVRASKRLFIESGERARPDDIQLSATQSHGVIPQAEYERLVGRKVVRILNHLDKRKHVEPDDFVISMRSFQGGLERAWARGAIRSSYVVLKPRGQLYIPYFAHLFKSQPYIQALRSTSQFIRDGQDLTFGNFSRVPLPLVPLDEQREIARFLDAHAAKVRRFIRNRRRLIEVLNEQKRALVTRCIVQQAASHSNLVASDVAWLSKVPEHWRSLKLKRVARINPSRSESVHQRTSDAQVVFLPMERVSADGQADMSEKRPIREVWQGFTYFKRGDVVVAKITPCFENGKGACLTELSSEIGFGTTEFIVLRPIDAVLAEYIYQLTMLPEFRCAGVESMTGAAGQQRVSPDFVGNFVVPIPPMQEQELIVAQIQGETSALNAAISRIEKEIDLIQEYRTRLIADAVTGKIDVRGLAPDGPEASAEPLDDVLDDAELEDAEDELVEEAPDAAD